jgi:hypothetical protein
VRSNAESQERRKEVPGEEETRCWMAEGVANESSLVRNAGGSAGDPCGPADRYIEVLHSESEVQP